MFDKWFPPPKLICYNVLVSNCHSRNTRQMFCTPTSLSCILCVRACCEWVSEYGGGRIWNWYFTENWSNKHFPKDEKLFFFCLIGIIKYDVVSVYAKHNVCRVFVLFLFSFWEPKIILINHFRVCVHFPRARVPHNIQAAHVSGSTYIWDNK